MNCILVTEMFTICLATSIARVGRFEKGLQELQEAVHLNPENSVVRESLMRNYMELNRLPEAKAFFKESVDAGADAAFGMHTARYAIAIAEGDEKTAQEQLKWLNDRPIWWRDHTFVQRAEAAAFGGDLAAARNLSQELFVKGGTEGVKAYVPAGWEELKRYTVNLKKPGRQLRRVWQRVGPINACGSRS